MREVFLDNLSRWENGKNKGEIDWNKSIGKFISFIYDDINGELEILNYNNKKQKVTVIYNKVTFITKTENLQKGMLGKIINNIVVSAPWMVKYFQGGYDEAKLYTRSSNEKLYFKCPDCGRLKNKLLSISNLNQNKSIGCPCSDGKSFPNKLIFKLMEQLKNNQKINYFETEYSPNWINRKAYDIYFKNNNEEYIVEMDGGLGHGRKVHSLSGQSVKETQQIDDYKDEMANKQDIEVIRIDAIKSDLEYIKNNILNSRLNELFDLNKIDWLECEEFALGNLIKIACDFWNNGIKNAREISLKMNLDKVTIIKYLKQGSEFNWCDYNPKEEKLKASISNGRKGNKFIEIFKNNTSMGIFKSITELSNQSEKLFGVKFSNSGISRVIRGEYDTYKNYFSFKEVQLNIKEKR